MASDMSQLGARWIRIEFHAEYDVPSGPGPIDYGKHDWFINEVAPKYGLSVLAVLGSGLIGDLDPTWSFEHINDPLNESGTNAYIDVYLERVREIIARYGDRIAAVEILNEPNASEVLSMDTQGIEKSVHPANFGELIARAYDVVMDVNPETQVIMGGVLFDDENGTAYTERGKSYDLAWLEGVYSSRAVMSYKASKGRHPFDAISVHPYFMEPNQIIDYLHLTRELQLRFDDRSGRVWITEVGWPAEPPEDWASHGLGVPSESEREQAAFMSAIYTTVRQKAPFVERIFWFKYEDFPVNGKLNGWGLVRLQDSRDAYASYANPWPRKFAFSVYQALARPDYLPIAPVEPPDDVGDRVHYFPETGHTLRDPFLAFWEAQGGLEIYGLPITEPFDQGGRMVQYFERARFEQYPDQAAEGWGVQLGLLGTFLTQRREFERHAPPEAGAINVNYFPESGQRIHGAFNLFWEQHGGLRQFGMPLSPEIIEDGVLVQYFERARFEYARTPDGTGFYVRLGDIGSEAIEVPGWYR
jgi:hypothetical protein